MPATPIPNDNSPARAKSEAVDNLCPIRRTCNYENIPEYLPTVN